MPIPAALAAALATLTEALDEPGIDVAMTLRRLGADAALAVRSYLGLTITAVVEGHSVSFTELRSEQIVSDAATSLRMTLPPAAKTGGSEPTMSLVLYAATPGAFVDLAADLAWLTGAGPDGFIVDADVTVPETRSSGEGLTALSAINQAVGVLLGSGYSIEQAREHLDLLATQTGSDRYAAALKVLAEAQRRELPWLS